MKEQKEKATQYEAAEKSEQTLEQRVSAMEKEIAELRVQVSAWPTMVSVEEVAKELVKKLKICL